MRELPARQVRVLSKGVVNLKAEALGRMVLTPLTTLSHQAFGKNTVPQWGRRTGVREPQRRRRQPGHAEFGLRIKHQGAEVNDLYEFKPPHPDAWLVAWFKATDPNGTTSCHLTCLGLGSFTLVDGEGSEIVQPSPDERDRWGGYSTEVSRTFHGGCDWRWFSLTNNAGGL